MAENASDDLSYFVVVREENRDDLAALRQWGNLKAAFDEKLIWLKDLDYAQVNSTEVKSLPYKTIYYAKGGKLFPLHSALPLRNVPALLWTPIDRALPVKLPAFNHNYFGVHDKIQVKLVPSETEAEAEMMITHTDTLQHYLETAPAVRLQPLSWVLLDIDKALLIGKPLLPVTGEVYWKRGNHLLPAGFDFELFLLSDTVNSMINPESNAFIIWNPGSTYFLAEKSALQPLSLSSFRRTMHDLIPHP